MIDWEREEPAPFYPVEAHDEIDALMVERNSALAEARLWFRRLQRVQSENERFRKELFECAKSLDSWEAAYYELLREFRRLEVKYSDAQWSLEMLRDFEDAHLWPLALARLQDLSDDSGVVAKVTAK